MTNVITDGLPSCSGSSPFAGKGLASAFPGLYYPGDAEGKLRLMKLIVFILLPMLAAAGTPAPAPSPSPAARKISSGFLVELYFEKPAKILPWKEETKTTIVEEVPFLADADFSSATVISLKRSRYLVACELTPAGLEKLREASLGNLGRMVVFALDGGARATYKLTREEVESTMRLGGILSKEEAERIAERINYRPIPTPFPAASPTPPPDQNTVVF
jgi:hypothetical protein